MRVVAFTLARCPPTRWWAALDPQAPLSERVAARRAAGALAGALGQWARWDGEHRCIGFVDDGYADAQFLLARYEALAGSAVPNARAAQAELERLSLGTAARSL